MKSSVMMLYFGEIEDLTKKYSVLGLGSIHDKIDALGIRRCEWERYCNDIKEELLAYTSKDMRTLLRPTVKKICDDLERISVGAYVFVTPEVEETWEEYKQRRGLNGKTPEDKQESTQDINKYLY